MEQNAEEFNTKPTCRICFSSSENLISSPCNCIGTLGYVHRNCFLRWIANIRRFDKCEICHQNYNSSILPQRYTKYDYDILKFYNLVYIVIRSFWRLFKAFFPHPFFALCKFSVNVLLATGAGLFLSMKVRNFTFKLLLISLTPSSCRVEYLCVNIKNS